MNTLPMHINILQESNMLFLQVVVLDVLNPNVGKAKDVNYLLVHGWLVVAVGGEKDGLVINQGCCTAYAVNKLVFADPLNLREQKCSSCSLAERTKSIFEFLFHYRAVSADEWPWS